jgi:iron complex transport system permease protein
MTSGATADPPAVAPPRHGRLVTILLATVCLLGIASSWYLSQGQPAVGLDIVWSSLNGSEPPSEGAAAYLLIREVRLPRLVLALVAGITLALSGVIMQDALRNPIADPGLLGIAQAASLVVAFSLFLPGLVPVGATPVLALAAGFGTGALLVLVARSVRDPVRLILIGAVLATLYATLTTVVVLVVPQPELASGTPVLLRFMLGSVSAGSWAAVGTVLPWAAIAIPAALLTGRTLNLLQLGDDLATGLGLRVTRARLIVLGVAVLLVSPVVAVVGPIAFVALLSPHVARLSLATTNANSVLLASAAIGALVVVLADTAGRLLFFPYEIPVGIWTVLVVGPVAVWLARTQVRGGSEVVPA